MKKLYDDTIKPNRNESHSGIKRAFKIGAYSVIAFFALVIAIGLLLPEPKTTRRPVGKSDELRPELAAIVERSRQSASRLVAEGNADARARARALERARDPDEENIWVSQYPTMASCLAGLEKQLTRYTGKHISVRDARVSTDRANKVNGWFSGHKNRFECERRDSGTLGTFWRGIIFISERDRPRS